MTAEPLFDVPMEEAGRAYADTDGPLTRAEAATLARDLMDAHGLADLPFAFDRAKTRLGAMHWKRSTAGVRPSRLTLSGPFVAVRPASETRETILHEIAHALAGHSAGHGPKWRAIARQVGARPQRCATEGESPAGAWVGTCPEGHTYDRHRRPKGGGLCRKCIDADRARRDRSTGRYLDAHRYEITWRRR